MLKRVSSYSSKLLRWKYHNLITNSINPSVSPSVRQSRRKEGRKNVFKEALNEIARLIHLWPYTKLITY